MTEKKLIEYRASATRSVTLAVSVWEAPSDRYLISLLLHDQQPATERNELCFVRRVADTATDSFQAPVHPRSASSIWKAVTRIQVRPTLEHEGGCDGETSTLTIQAGLSHTEYEWWWLPDGWESVDAVGQRLHRLADRLSVQHRGRECLAESAFDFMRRLSTEDHG